jgi:hypothetical protein
MFFSVTIQFIHHIFLEEYNPTIEHSYRHRVAVDDVACLLDVDDAAAHDEFSVLSAQFQQHAEGFLCIYSITSRSSFVKLATFLRIKAQETNDVPMSFICSKTSEVWRTHEWCPHRPQPGVRLAASSLRRLPSKASMWNRATTTPCLTSIEH